MSTATLDTPLIGATVHPVRDRADADDFLECVTCAPDLEIAYECFPSHARTR